MRIRCKLLVAIAAAIVLLILCVALNSVVIFARLVDYLGLPSTLYMPNVSCRGCNKFNAAYIIEPPRSAYCTHDKPVFLVILVASQPDNFQRRMAIRRSWGSISAHRGQSIRTVFMLGRAADSTEQVSLDSEAHQWHDVLQVGSLATTV